jgi:hypothetical protein
MNKPQKLGTSLKYTFKLGLSFMYQFLRLDWNILIKPQKLVHEGQLADI